MSSCKKKVCLQYHMVKLATIKNVCLPILCMGTDEPFTCNWSVYGDSRKQFGLANTCYSGKYIWIIDCCVPVLDHSAIATHVRSNSSDPGALTCDTTVSCVPLKTGIVSEQLLQLSNSHSCS